MVIPMPEKQPITTISHGGSRQDIPGDLILIVVWLAASIVAIYLPFLNGTPVRIALALPVILFIPGYCLLALLFPKNGDIDLMPRMVLSIGVSIALVPLIGLGLNFTPWGIRLDPIVLSLTLFTLVMTLIILYQRSLLPSEERFRIPLSAIGAAIQEEVWQNKGSTNARILSGVLVFAICITILTAVYVVTVPLPGEPFTEFFILGENRTAAHYPEWIIPGQNYSLFVGVGNHENGDSTYTIETWMLQTESDNSTNRSRILIMDPDNRVQFTLADNQTTIIPYNLSVPNITVQNVSVPKIRYDRVEFLLFKGTLPGHEVSGTDRINASFRNLHLNIKIRRDD
jgi:uncharacterized membrane protein